MYYCGLHKIIHVIIISLPSLAIEIPLPSSDDATRMDGVPSHY